MNMGKFDEAATKLREIANRIKNSQRFGVPLPVGTTERWSEELGTIGVQFNEAFAVSDVTQDVTNTAERVRHVKELQECINRLSAMGEGSLKNLAAEMTFHLGKFDAARAVPEKPASGRVVKGFAIKTEYWE